MSALCAEKCQTTLKMPTKTKHFKKKNIKICFSFLCQKKPKTCFPDICKLRPSFDLRSVPADAHGPCAFCKSD